jgi:hypothetical protein
MKDFLKLMNVSSIIFLEYTYAGVPYSSASFLTGTFSIKKSPLFRVNHWFRHKILSDASLIIMII